MDKIVIEGGFPLNGEILISPFSGKPPSITILSILVFHRWFFACYAGLQAISRRGFVRIEIVLNIRLSGRILYLSRSLLSAAQIRAQIGR